MFSMLILVLFVLTFSGVHLIGTENPDEYGPYVVDFSKYELCHGPKSKDVADTVMDIFQNADQDFIANITMKYLEPVRMDEIKIAVYSLKQTKKTMLWSYRVDKPCQHYIIAETLEKQLKARNCVVKKGTYNILINYSDYAKKFFGQNFFYGEYLFRVYVLSKNANICCIIYKPVFTKKT